MNSASAAPWYVVVRDDTGVVARARRVVLVGLGRVTAAREVHRQTRIGVRRRDHRDAAVRRLVQHRDLDRRAAGVEGADRRRSPCRSRRTRSRSRSTCRSPTCRPAPLRRRTTGSRCCSRRPSSPAGRAEPDRRDDLLGLRPRRPLEHEVGGHDVVGVSVALVLDSGACRRRQGFRGAAAAAPSAARRDEARRATTKRPARSTPLFLSFKLLLLRGGPRPARAGRSTCVAGV